MASEFCPVCANLDYDKFGGAPTGKRGPTGERNYHPLPPSPLPRYRTASRGEVAAAADAGCGFCRVLEDGMLYAWGDNVAQTEFSHVAGRHDQIDNGEADVKGSDRKSEQGGGAAAGLAGEDEEIWPQRYEVEDRICVKLQPERSLTVMWVGCEDLVRDFPRPDVQPFRSQKYLDFYVDAGRLYPPRLPWIPSALTPHKKTTGPPSAMPLVGRRAWRARSASSPLSRWSRDG
jgi:hypothetical protein